MKYYLAAIFFGLGVLYFFSILVGCQHAPPVLPPAVLKDVLSGPAPAQPLGKLAWDGKHEYAPHWTSHLTAEIANSKLDQVVPKDMVHCPPYEKLTTEQRRYVWAQLISKMAQYESGYKPGTEYQEAFKDAKGKNVISRGLLQISQESANSYGCGITESELLHDYRINLSCGVKIIERWAVRDGAMMGSKGQNLGCGRYWSVCRTTSGSYAKISAYLKALPVCQR